jgi:hypothetical protein
MQGLTSIFLRFRTIFSQFCRPFSLSLAAGVVGTGIAACGPQVRHREWSRPDQLVVKPTPAAEWVIQSPAGVPRPPFAFAKDDQAFLEEVQRASFWYLWCACDPTTGMVYDRSSVTFASVAGVGFQLAALPIAVERGWVSRSDAETRAITILRALENEPTNRKAGLFYHFLDGPTAKPIDNDVVSTVDSALLFSGMLAAGMYFEGEVRERGDRMVEAADWSFFVERAPREHEPHMKGYITLGWKATNFADPIGPGRILHYYWADSGDEHRLVTFLAAMSPRAAHRVDPTLYFQLRRQLGEYGDSGAMVWFPWSGALFVNFFAHLFIDYAGRGPDAPSAMGVQRRPRVDWWENSRRAVRLHQLKAIENPKKLPTLGENAWGLTASDDAKGYAVPGVFPNAITTPDAIPDVDFAVYTPKDNYGDGTIAPYGAGCAIMFDPVRAIAALRHSRALNTSDGSPLVWREPSAWPCATPNFGFQDSFNVGTNWVAPDCVAIDQGPLVLAIENARTGLVWKLFESHPWVRAGMGRIGVAPASRAIPRNE